MVKSEIYKLNRLEILNQIKRPYKKINYAEHAEEIFHLQPYLVNLNINDARTKFKIKTKMTPTIRMNFASDDEFASKLWSCPGCSEDKSVYSKVEGFRDTQSHVMVCAGYSDLREGKDLNTDKDLVKYFQMVIKKRIDLLE